MAAVVDAVSDVVFTSTAIKTKDNESGARFLNQYQVLDVIGRGSFSTVKLWRDETLSSNEAGGGLVAVKIVNRMQLAKVKTFKAKPTGGMGVTTAMDRVYEEIQLWKTLVHPNLCKLIEVIDSSELMKLYMVMEYLPGGMLMQVNHQNLTYTSTATGTVLPPIGCVGFIRDIATALTHLKSLGIVHRDVKPDNILWDGCDRYVLSDFGNAIQLEGDQKETGMLRGSPGTYAFFAPEVCSGGDYNGYTADVWALGVSLHAALFGEPPFYSQGASQLFEMILNEPYSIPDDKPHSNQVLQCPQVCDMLLGLLKNNADERFTTEIILEHDFVTTLS